MDADYKTPSIETEFNKKSCFSYPGTTATMFFTASSPT